MILKASKLYCHYCKAKGHVARNCTKKKESRIAKANLTAAKAAAAAPAPAQPDIAPAAPAGSPVHYSQQGLTALLDHLAASRHAPQGAPVNLAHVAQQRPVQPPALPSNTTVTEEGMAEQRRAAFVYEQRRAAMFQGRNVGAPGGYRGDAHIGEASHPGPYSNVFGPHMLGKAMGISSPTASAVATLVIVLSSDVPVRQYGSAVPYRAYAYFPYRIVRKIRPFFGVPKIAQST